MDNSIEQWEDIEGYEGFYQISNLGNVKSLSRYINKKSNTLGFLKERIMKQYKQKNGYLKINFCKDSNLKTFYIHFLVAKAFLPKKINDDYIIDHINNIKTDNKVCNLQYISFRENLSKDKINKTNFLGVYKNGKKYCSKICIDGVKKYLGAFNTPEEAHNEYIKNLNLIKNNNNGTTKRT